MLIRSQPRQSRCDLELGQVKPHRNLGQLLIKVACGLILSLSGAFSGIGPENVILVYREDRASSKRIAQYYAKLRNIQDIQCIALGGIGDEKELSLSEFKTRLLEPLFKEIKLRNLARQTDIIIYSTGFPLKIDFSEFVPKGSLAHIENTYGSLTGLTYLYASIMSRQKNFILPKTNLYAHSLKLPKREEWKDGDMIFYAHILNQLNTNKNELRKEMVDGLKKLSEKYPNSADVKYYLARVLAIQGHSDEANQTLFRAVQSGWLAKEKTIKDPAFKSINSTEVFQAILERMHAPIFPVTESRAFRSSWSWTAKGPIRRGQGRRYVLSATLGVEHSLGQTESQILNSIQTSVRADASFPQGTFYFMKSEDKRSLARSWGFPAAEKSLKKMGFKVEILDGVLPPKGSKVLGLMTGSAEVDPKTLDIQPGAFCDHLTSWGSDFERKKQSKCTTWLNHGSAGSSGTVSEPLALAFKFPAPWIHVHYARGASLGEAFYQSIDNPYQILLVGDPLCQPWARNESLKVQGVTEREHVKEDREVSFEIPTYIKSGHIEVYINGILSTAVGLRESYFIRPKLYLPGKIQFRFVAVSDELLQPKSSAMLHIQI